MIRITPAKNVDVGSMVVLEDDKVYGVLDVLSLDKTIILVFFSHQALIIPEDEPMREFVFDA